jgi:hypothetical protein
MNRNEAFPHVRRERSWFPGEETSGDETSPWDHPRVRPALSMALTLGVGVTTAPVILSEAGRVGVSEGSQIA